MLLNNIRSDKSLGQFVRGRCEDEGICVEFDSKVDSNDCVIIKVDDYYNSLKIEKRPPSPDCLILQKCNSNQYLITIVEFKDISTSSSFEIDKMLGKFDTCLSNFMLIKFKKYFNRDYVRVNLYFVSNIEIHRRDLGDKMKILMNKRFKFRGKSYLIQPKMPTPTIKPCY